MTSPSLVRLFFILQNALFGVFDFIFAVFRVFPNFRPGFRVSRLFCPGLRVLVPPKAPLYQQVVSFKYLGSTITVGEKYCVDIRRKMEIAKCTFENRGKILYDRKLPLKCRVLQSYLASTLMYTSECWTISSEIGKELWCYKRMLRLPWTNEEVLKRIGKERALIKRIRKR